MSRSCVICYGASAGFTVAADEKGERALVHAASCAAILSERRQVAARAEETARRRDGKRVPRKTAGISMWTAGWEFGRFGPQHELPCDCPKHREESMDRSNVDISWDRVIADDPDIEYQ
jgi:hypothetical protein